MRRLVAFMICAVSLVAAAQTTITYPYNPDSDGDSLITVHDIQDLISAWGPFDRGPILIDGCDFDFENVCELEETLSSIQSENDSLASSNVSLMHLVDSLSELVPETWAFECLSPFYQFQYGWDDGGQEAFTSNLQERYDQIDSLIPGYMSICQLAEWQAPVSTNPGGCMVDCYPDFDDPSKLTCFWQEVLYDAQQVVQDLEWFLSAHEEYDIDIPSADCFLELHNLYCGGASCEDWTVSPTAGSDCTNGYHADPCLVSNATTSWWQQNCYQCHGGPCSVMSVCPDQDFIFDGWNNGAGHYDASDCEGGKALLLQSTGYGPDHYEVQIPGTYNYAFLSGLHHGYGGGRHYYVHYNPESTIIVGEPTGSGGGLTLIEDSNL